MPAGFLQGAQGARQIGHPGAGQAFGGAGRGLGQRSGQRRAVPVLNDDAACAEGERRAKDGADILRIGQLVQHDEDAARRMGQIVQFDALQRLDLEHHALMHGTGRQQARQPVGLDHLYRMPVQQLVALELGGAVGRGHQTAHALTRRIGERRQNRVTTPDEGIGIQPVATLVTPLVPGWFSVPRVGCGGAIPLAAGLCGLCSAAPGGWFTT